MDESMKANELMIGDWVKITHRNKIGKVYRVDIANGNGNGWVAVIDGDYYEGDLEPIPLTAEILEKNGFKPYIPEGHLETVYACQDVSKAVADELYALWPYQDGSFYLLLRVDGKDMVRMDVHYIHQLQHALGLCEIEKEIIL